MSSSPILLREIALALFIVSLLAVSASATSVTRAVAESRYSHAHSLGDSYSFDPRDGWHSVNVSNLPYKYEPRALEPRSARKKPKGKGKLGGLGKLVSASLKGLKGIGKPQEVKITWWIRDRATRFIHANFRPKVHWTRLGESQLLGKWPLGSNCE